MPPNSPSGCAKEESANGGAQALNHTIVIASRESALAIIQSNTIVRHLEHTHPQMRATLLTMKTTGDRILDRTLDQVGGKGLFVLELHRALQERRADIAVHSLKDLPMELPEELPILCYSKREDPRDALVLRDGLTREAERMVVGTSSLRRTLQIKALYPNWTIRPVRGTVQTRLRKLDEGQFDALIMAASGLKRLGLEHRIHRYFSVDEMLPAAGQGILAVQGRRGERADWLAGYADEHSAIAAECERAFVRTLNGGCTSPVCAHAVIDGNHIQLRGLYYNEENGAWRKGAMRGELSSAAALGATLAQALRDGKDL
ncbi:MAG: hydroxymethylbilane synthase [Clostridia bacterium]|nr:hydroxymethylbilane synthase [Clostridia bacterium]